MTTMCVFFVFGWTRYTPQRFHRVAVWCNAWLCVLRLDIQEDKLINCVKPLNCSIWNVAVLMTVPWGPPFKKKDPPKKIWSTWRLLLPPNYKYAFQFLRLFKDTRKQMVQAAGWRFVIRWNALAFLLNWLDSRHATFPVLSIASELWPQSLHSSLRPCSHVSLFSDRNRG